MKFTYVVEVDTDRDSPNMIGEFLRSKFWPPEKGFGCYSNFEWGPEVKSLDPREERYNDNFWDGQDNYVTEKWTRGEWQGIVCEYYWDGDGSLRFIFPDGTSLLNTDCKHDHYWQWESDAA